MARPHDALGIFADVLGLVAGLVVCFAGYRILKSLAALAGLLIGFVFGLVFGTALTGVPLVGLVAGVGCGILLALVFSFAFRLAGAVLGAFLGASLAALFGYAGLLLVVLVIVGALVGLVANKPLIILATALEGAALAVTSALSLLDLAGADPQPKTMILIVGTAALAIVGALAQWRHLRSTPE